MAPRFHSLADTHDLSGHLTTVGYDVTLKSKLFGIHSLLNETSTSLVLKGLGNVLVGSVVFDILSMILINSSVFCSFEVLIWIDDPTLDPFIVSALLLLFDLFISRIT